MYTSPNNSTVMPMANDTARMMRREVSGLMSSSSLSPPPSTIMAWSCQVTFKWCPGHCGITGNELANAQAKTGADAGQTDVDHHYTTVKAMIHRTTKGRPALHKLTQRIYGDRGSKVKRKKES